MKKFEKYFDCFKIEKQTDGTYKVFSIPTQHFVVGLLDDLTVERFEQAEKDLAERNAIETEMIKLAFEEKRSCDNCGNLDITQPSYSEPFGSCRCKKGYFDSVSMDDNLEDGTGCDDWKERQKRFSVGVEYIPCSEKDEREILFETDDFDEAFKEYKRQIDLSICLDGPTFNIIENKTGRLFQHGNWYN